MGEGILFYVIGASGAGKDSVLNGARMAMDGRAKVAFAHRYITRPANAGGENHVALTEGEFSVRKENGLFRMAWESHGNHYGIGIETDLWLTKGFGVVVNGSRAYLQTAARIFPGMVVIHIRVSRKILRQRLLERGRESLPEIENRLRRSNNLPPLEYEDTHIINNDNALEDSVSHFLAVVNSRLPDRHTLS